MSTPDFNSLGFSDEAVPVDFQNVPEQITTREPLPQPGPGYAFRLPQISLTDIVDKANGKTVGFDKVVIDKGDRLAVNFRNELSLVCVKATRPEFVGRPMPWYVTNKEAQWDEEKSPTSDMLYLIKDGLGGADLSNKPNRLWAEEIVKHAGKVFGADVVWTANCSERNDIYRVKVDEKTGDVVESGVVQGKKGCGRRYGLLYKKAKGTRKEQLLIPRYDQDDPDGRHKAGDWAERFDCACGARISVFPALRAFHRTDADGNAVKGGEAKK